MTMTSEPEPEPEAPSGRLELPLVGWAWPLALRRRLTGRVAVSTASSSDNWRRSITSSERAGRLEGIVDGIAGGCGEGRGREEVDEPVAVRLMPGRTGGGFGASTVSWFLFFGNAYLELVNHEMVEFAHF